MRGSYMALTPKQASFNVQMCRLKPKQQPGRRLVMSEQHSRLPPYDAHSVCPWLGLWALYCEESERCRPCGAEGSSRIWG